MELMEAIRGRRSVRKFKPDPVQEEDLREILEAARWAANAGNSQPWHFLVVRGEGLRQSMAQAVERMADQMAGWPEVAEMAARIQGSLPFWTFFREAPVTLAVLARPYEATADLALAQKGLPPEEVKRMRPYPGLQSVSAAIQNLLLAAHSLGYGTCWMTGPLVAYRELEEILGVKAPWELVALVPLGRPADLPSSRPRRGIEEIATFLD
ncbi:MAG: nitroreductase family protein [Candidatus Tectomicrobia bacterium]|uniref:Nitroreductase family protein n=1 Tax=Tectimicrobiota bacterium TaxID=2528274 RepID=A0A932CR27_UNCTE|nr:nitroreductase family protein [Candidatus Tectomicrobia bacterium]